MVCVFCMKIVKRRYVRIFLWEYVARDAHYPLHDDWCLTAPSDRSREAGLFCQYHCGLSLDGYWQ